MYLEIKSFPGSVCPVCEAELGLQPVTAMATANTAPALQMMRGYGHLVVLTGQYWQVRCVKDAHSALRPLKVPPDLLVAQVAVSGAAGQAGQRSAPGGSPRGRGAR